MSRSKSRSAFIPLFARIAAIVGVLLLVKALVHILGVDTMTMTRLHSALATGVLFTLAVIFTGTLGDYKEAERIPGEFAVPLKSLCKDGRLACGNHPVVADMRKHAVELLQLITTNFRNGEWKVREITSAFDKIDGDILRMGTAGAAPQFLVKLRADLGTLERTSNRVESIMQTTFVPMAYVIAEVAVVGLLLNLLFVHMDPLYEGLAIFGALAFLLISLLFLIRDMDDPFAGYARVDLSLLHKLERYFAEEGALPSSGGLPQTQEGATT